MANWFQKRVSGPLKALLSSGLTPRELAAAFAIGAAIGVFPWLGTTTVLSTAVALGCRLNLAAVQLANWLVSPLQLALILPFIRAGEVVTGNTPLPLGAAELKALFDAGAMEALRTLGASSLDAALGWLLFVPVVAAAACFALRPALQRLTSWRAEATT